MQADPQPVMEDEKIPRIVLEVGFDFRYDKSKLWQLDVPATRMGIEELVWHLDVPFLRDSRGFKSIRPIDVMNDPLAYEAQYRRVEAASLCYPIDIMRNKGRWLIMDGLHRLMKSSMIGEYEVDVRRIPCDMIPYILKEGAGYEACKGDLSE